MWRKAGYLQSASFAAISTPPVILGCALFGATGAGAVTCAEDATSCKPFVVNFVQDPNNGTIIATGTGEFNTMGLTPSSNFGIVTRAQSSPSVGQLTFGSVSGLLGFDVSGPTNTSFIGGIVGTTPTVGGTSISGPALGINGGIPGFSPQSFLSLPNGYMSGAVVTSQASFLAASLSCAVPGVNPCDGLGWQPDETFTWTWGQGMPDQSFTINTSVSVIPAPAALPLFATGLGALGLLGWRRKRRTQSVA